MFLSLCVKIGSAPLIPIIRSELTYHVYLLACKNKNWVSPLPIIVIIVAYFWKQPDVSIAVCLWVVKFWHDRSVFTLGGVGYKFGLSLWW